MFRWSQAKDAGANTDTILERKCKRPCKIAERTPEVNGPGSGIIYLVNCCLSFFVVVFLFSFPFLLCFLWGGVWSVYFVCSWTIDCL